MKRYIIIFFYLIMLFSLESIFVSFWVIQLYSERTNDLSKICNPHTYEANYTVMVIGRFYLNMYFYMVPHFLIYSFVIKKTPDQLSYYKNVTYQVCIFLLETMFYGLFLTGGLGLGVDNCISYPMRYAIVGSSVIFAPILTKFLGINKLLFREKSKEISSSNE